MLSFGRVYSSNINDDNQTLGNFTHSFDKKINPKFAYDKEPLASSRYATAQEACEKGFSEIAPKVLLGKLEGDKAIYNEAKGLCDIYEDSTIVASMPVKNSVTKSLASEALKLLRSADGTEQLFYKNKEGSYISLTRSPSILKETDEGYELTLADDTVEYYDQDGRLIKITNGAQELTLDYNDKGALKSLTNSFDQTIEMTYESNSALLKEIKSYDDTNITYSYDDKNRLTKVTYADGSTKSYEYDSDGKLVVLKDASGTVTKTYRYDNGKVVSTADTNGANAKTLSYTKENTTLTQNGNAREYSFLIQHSQAKVSTIEDDEGIESYTYDANGYPLSHTDKLGVTTLTTYNDRGLLVSKIAKAGTSSEEITLTSYHEKFHKPTKIVKAGVATFYEYNDKGLLTKKIQGEVNPASYKLTANFKQLNTPMLKAISSTLKETSIEYDDKGLPKATTAPNGAVSKTEYDEQGNPKERTNALGFSTKSEFDKAGRPTKTTDANGIVTTTKYDSMGRVLQSTTEGKTTKYEYDTNGRLTKTVYPDGLETYSRYDSAGNVVESGDNQGNKTLNEYDANNNLIKTQTYKNNTLTYQSQSEYDSKNRLIVQIDGLGNKTIYIYNQKGQKIKTVDPLNRETTYEYDALGRLAKEIKPDGSTTTYSYNTQGQKTEVVTPNKATFKFAYDALQRVTLKDNPDKGTTTYSYDVSDNIIKECDSKDNCIEYSYDLLNRKTKETFSDGTTIEYEYDQGENAKGKLTKVTDSSGSTEFAYDKDGNIISISQTITSTGSVTLVTNYEYDDKGKLTSKTLPSGKTIEYSYNDKSELTSISIDGQTLIEDIKTSNQGLLSYSYPNNNQHQRVYDTAGRLTKLIYPNYTKELTYNQVSNITKLKTNNTQKSFNYDLVDRLISYDHNQSDYQRFTYDDNGNRLSLNQEVNKTISLNYQDASNILTTIKQIKRVDENTTQVEQELNLTYDKNGNIIDDTIHTYSYDAKNRLIAIDDNITCSYNYKNQRVSKTINNQTTYFIYDDYKLIGEYNQDGTPIKEYIYLNDTPIAIITPDNTYYIYTDHIDTPRVVADADNNIIWKWESKPFGETKPNQDPDQDGNSFTLNLRFPGQYHDQESGLYYNFNRYYSPILGRYITSDPIGFDGGSNTYLYAGGNPVSGFDAEGLYRFSKLKAAYQSREEAFSGRKRNDYDATYEYDAVWASSGGSCAYRLSNAFNRAGYANIMQSAWKYTKYRTLAYKPTGERYIYSSFELAEYLGVFSSRFKVTSYDDILYRKGIIYFHDSHGGHIDLVETREGWLSDYLYMIGNGEEVRNYMQSHSSTYFMDIEP